MFRIKIYICFKWSRSTTSWFKLVQCENNNSFNKNILLEKKSWVLFFAVCEAYVRSQSKAKRHEQCITKYLFYLFLNCFICLLYLFVILSQNTTALLHLAWFPSIMQLYCHFKYIHYFSLSLSLPKFRFYNIRNVLASGLWPDKHSGILIKPETLWKPRKLLTQEESDD